MVCGVAVAGAGGVARAEIALGGMTDDEAAGRAWACARNPPARASPTVNTSANGKFFGFMA
jgi:hypothetical protein